MAKIAVVFWSGTGNTETMAQSVAEGASKTHEVEVFSVDSTDAATVATFDKVALGCPAMGDEQLEEDEFEPFYNELKTQLGDKPVALFGSFSWAGEDGEGVWMQNWVADAKEVGLNLVNEGLICFEAPEDDKLAECVALGEALANA